MKQWISDNLIAVLTALIVLTGGYIELRLQAMMPSDADIQEKVNDAFTHAGSVAPHRMNQAEEDIEDLEAADGKLDDKITRIIDILLEE